jgi:hypothetical protein
MGCTPFSRSALHAGRVARVIVPKAERPAAPCLRPLNRSIKRTAVTRQRDKYVLCKVHITRAPALVPDASKAVILTTMASFADRLACARGLRRELLTAIGPRRCASQWLRAFAGCSNCAKWQLPDSQ